MSGPRRGQRGRPAETDSPRTRPPAKGAADHRTEGAADQRTQGATGHRADSRADSQAERRAERVACVPAIVYPPDLPVVARRDDIAAAIRDHQVVVIAGETGSGKTTQIPKICLELGRGIDAMIGHTQPRRIAARAVAERIAFELGVELGGAVGYQVRFTDRASRDTLLKVMTDGILLAELQRDRDLRRYDTIIIDEAHERSLNIDFLLGYLRQLLPRRPDLKIVITSATIDPDKLAAHFSAPDGTPAPVIEVSGRTYPVEVRYRPLERADATGHVSDIDQVTGICEAVEELWTEGGHDSGDVLVFLSGEREIRDTADAIGGLELPRTEVVPLFARLSAAEQHRVFAEHPGRRRVILATNVAETSLTVPGIRYVVDAGTARISRYSQRTKVQRLPIEPISQASAAQRAGRCGRLADGVCIRLYSEDDFAARPDFTDPEILRTNLASVILAMTALGLGDLARFPFVDPPDPRQITDGIRLLEELQAVAAPEERAGGRPLTAYGMTIARLPVDPRLARMVIEADKLGVLREVIVVVAAMSIQDPRERPLDKQELAAAAHKRFATETSDFAGLLALWAYLREQQAVRSGNGFRRMCREEFLHYLRVREWADLVSQLTAACRQARLDVSRGPTAGEPDLDAVHRALLAGLLSHVGVREEATRDYLGARGGHFAISPGSGLFRRQPQFVMAGELVETTRTWARLVARIDPLWAEELGAHLVRRSYSEPRWSASQGSAVATERVTLYGVPIVTGRTIGLGRVDPVTARAMFIQRALVEGDWTTRQHFFHENRRLVERLGELEARARRRDLIVSDEVLARFYDERLPESVVSARHFDTWWKQTRRHQPDLLTFTEDLLLQAGRSSLTGEDYPTTWRQGELTFAVTYRFEPGAPRDGVTVHLPVEVLNQVQDTGFDWLVPGLREDLVTALIRSLPKAVRRLVVPAQDRASAVLAKLRPGEGLLTEQLGMLLRKRAGVVIGPGDWDWDRVPPHLRVTFVVEDGSGRSLAEGKDLQAMRDRAAPALARRVAAAASSLERRGVTTWDLGDIPDRFQTPATADQPTILGFPALVDDGTSVSLRVLPTRAEADAEHPVGVRRLLLRQTTAPWPRVLSTLTNAEKLALGHNPHGSVPALLQDCLDCAVDSIVAEHVGPDVRTAADYALALEAVRAHAVSRVLQVLRTVEPTLALHLQVVRRLDTMTAPVLAGLVADVRHQLGELVRPSFVADTGLVRLPDLTRYLTGAAHRLDKAPTALAKDARLADEVAGVEEAYAELLTALRPAQRGSSAVADIAWLIEELRVSYFAQTLGTPRSVSVQRVRKAISAVERGS